MARAKKTKKESIATTTTRRTTPAQRLKNIIATKQKRFEKATHAQKRVMIARDVLELIETRRSFREGVRTGAYVTLGGEVEADKLAAMSPTEFQEALYSPKVLNECNVCALGACFVSAVRLGDAFQPANRGDGYGLNVNGDETMWRHMEGIFEKDQMDLIETAFEFGDSNYEGEADEIERAEASGFTSDRDPDWKRLKMIMENIVKNRGTFKPKLDDKRVLEMWRNGELVRGDH